VGSIGDGRFVKITSDNWILSCPAYMLKPTKEIPDITIFHCLMDEHTRTWISETVYAFFDQETADQIMQIHISKDGDDFFYGPIRRMEFIQ
jgi:hypothetical protein